MVNSLDLFVGLEWVSKDTVITAAQDCTAKFSRLAASNPGKIKGPCLTLTTPIWRARPTVSLEIQN